MVEWKNSPDFWVNRKICVTGGAGFLGSYVLEKLENRGAEGVFVPKIEEYNLVEQQDVKRMLGEADPDIVIHLAANVGGIGANQSHPAEFFYDNLMMGVQLMHESWKRGVEKFVAIGTVCAYPKFTPIPFKENNIWDGYPEETNAPYGLAKKMLLVQSMAYRDQYDFNSLFLVPVNLYGPRDNFNLETSHVIPALIRKALEAHDRGDKEIVVWGDGSPTREFLFAEDAAEGILLATERYNSSDPVNLGSGEEISIRDLAGKIVELTGFEGELRWDTSRPNGQPRRALDTSRAKERFGFEAQVRLEEGLRHTVDWYKQHRKVIGKQK
jgi:GDP-L-fucose synthase